MRSNLKISEQENFVKVNSTSRSREHIRLSQRSLPNLTLVNSKTLSSNLNSRRGLFALFLLLLFQVLDGVFTYNGTSLHGHQMEGNPLISYLMSLVGSFWGISAAKIFSIIAILFLWNLRHKVRWIPKSIELLGAYYLVFAIIPWGLVLSGMI